MVTLQSFAVFDLSLTGSCSSLDGFCLWDSIGPDDFASLSSKMPADSHEENEACHQRTPRRLNSAKSRERKCEAEKENACEEPGPASDPLQGSGPRLEHETYAHDQRIEKPYKEICERKRRENQDQ